MQLIEKLQHNCNTTAASRSVGGHTVMSLEGTLICDIIKYAMNDVILKKN